ncbi:MAG: cysteine desulfurase [Acidobacteria bacterium]|nr:cysteine desulfurase [Acidobacteriota bacterium]
MTRFYFDHNATTPIAPAVREAVVHALDEAWANPSSIHQDGQRARRMLEEARARIASLLGCAPKEVVLTSGGTEADNLAILGVVRADPRPSRHVVTTAVEHPAVLEACAQLEREGVALTYLQPDRQGRIDADIFRRQLRPTTVLASVMHANNETGAVQDVAALAAIAREAGVLFHSDGVQAAGKLPVSLASTAISLYSISAHKLNAPKGCGALFVRQGVTLAPMLHGGRQERSRRAGTESVTLAIALGAAAQLDRPDLTTLRDRLEQGILARVADAHANAAAAPRLPNTTNIRFDGISAEALVIALDLRGFAVSTGAACSSGSVEPSHVLLAMGLSPEQARSSIRFSLGLGNTAEQVDQLIEAVAESVARLRKLSPTYSEVTP